jgi:hypothetical protein
MLAMALAATGIVHGDVFSNVPEAADYTLIYQLAIPNTANFKDATPVPYGVDRSSSLVLANGFDRVAYYMELDDGTGLKWVYASVDDFSGGSLITIGIPHNVDNPVAHQQIVNNMNVFASANTGLTTGEGIATGNIEMWPGNYSQPNAIGIPGADGGTFDFGDQNTGGTGSGHGSFQVHNHGAGEVLFAYNRWGTSGTSALGIGARPTSHPDWTFADNASGYTVKNLQILVREKDSGQMNAVRARAGEATDYELVYYFPVPTVPNAWNNNAIAYTVDYSDQVPDYFDRVAYYLELDSQWVYASMDAFTTDADRIGVPGHNGVNGNGGTAIWQFLTNMNVYASSGAGVATGTDIQTGNIEFWGGNYQTDNTLPVPGANGGTFDFGDNASGGSHGSMQIHNHGAGETLFAYNRWGGYASGASSIGIGNSPSGHPDWTFRQNAASYTTKNLAVMVRPRVFANVPGSSRYAIVYGLDIPRSGGTTFNSSTGGGVPYFLDRTADHAALSYQRVAYYLELKTPTGNLEWVFVSFDTIESDIRKIGVPNSQVGRVYQQTLSNMDVYAGGGAEARVTTGTGIATGNIEFWPNNYGPPNENSVPGADGGRYDFGDDVDEGTPSGYGSMQLHNHGAGQVIFSYSGWGNGGVVGNLGIGNNTVERNPGELHTDYTFRDTAGDYEIANLLVLVEMPPPGTRFLVK